MCSDDEHNVTAYPFGSIQASLKNNSTCSITLLIGLTANNTWINISVTEVSNMEQTCAQSNLTIFSAPDNDRSLADTTCASSSDKLRKFKWFKAFNRASIVHIVLKGSNRPLNITLQYKGKFYDIFALVLTFGS